LRRLQALNKRRYNTRSTWQHCHCFLTSKILRCYYAPTSDSQTQRPKKDENRKRSTQNKQATDFFYSSLQCTRSMTDSPKISIGRELVIPRSWIFDTATEFCFFFDCAIDWVPCFHRNSRFGLFFGVLWRTGGGETGVKVNKRLRGVSLCFQLT
jgi:hypothetical protein